jgi:hypothetical protein
VVSFFMSWIDLGFVSMAGFKLVEAASGTDKLVIIAWLVPIVGGITGYFTYVKNVNTAG